MERWKGIGLLLGAALAISGGSARAQQAKTANQTAADAVAASIRSSSSLKGVRVEIETREGQATLSGQVKTSAQKTEAIKLAMAAPGITGVVDKLQIVGDGRVRRAQYQVAAGGGIFHRRNGGYAGGDTIVPGDAGAAAGAGAGAYDPSLANGPAPEGAAGMMGGSQASMPNYPNYAWPSYAPYPNFSAVGYPTAYPWQAWPNIGPPYPYPEVPLDWRAVTLRWDDGIWWLDFKKHYTRPFFTPYPFGILAY